MPEENQIEQVNRHYLDRVMELAERLDVEATEDIVDARGMKLIAKGAPRVRACRRPSIFVLKVPKRRTLLLRKQSTRDSVLGESNGQNHFTRFRPA
jgi:hypothetical protein